MKPTPKTGICLVRLTSGEELIGSIDVNSVGDVYISKPAIVIIQPPQRQGEQLGIAMVGWLPYTKVSKEGMWIKNQHVIFITEPDDTMVKTYKERFTSDKLVAPQPELIRPSGIIVPSTKS